jgi:hypothetical protein
MFSRAITHTVDTLLARAERTPALYEQIWLLTRAACVAQLLGRHTRVRLVCLYRLASSWHARHTRHGDSFEHSDRLFRRVHRLLDQLVVSGGLRVAHGWAHERLTDLIRRGPTPHAVKHYHESDTYEMSCLRDLILEEELSGPESPQLLMPLLNLALLYGRREDPLAKGIVGERWLVISLAQLHREGKAEGGAALMYTAQLHEVRGETALADAAWARYYLRAVQVNEAEFTDVFHQQHTRWGYVHLLREYAGYLQRHGQLEQAAAMERRAGELEPLIDISLDR